MTDELNTGPADGDARVVVDTAIAATLPTQLDPATVYGRVLPEGATSEIVDLEEFMPTPRRLAGRVETHTVDDFERYVTRHDNPDRTTVWVDLDTHEIIAVLDDHAKDDQAWGTHRAALRLRTTKEWEHWLGKDDKLLEQEAFAEHIERGLPEIVTPDGATMLEIAQSIEGTTKADFKGAHRLDNGARGFEYVETVTAKAGQKGTLEIPARFELAIAPFLGEEPYKVGARLRYRVRGSQLELGYVLDRPHDVIRDAIDQVATRLAQTFTGDRVFVGKPRD